MSQSLPGGEPRTNNSGKPLSQTRVSRHSQVRLYMEERSAIAGEVRRKGAFCQKIEKKMRVEPAKSLRLMEGGGNEKEPAPLAREEMMCASETPRKKSGPEV